MPSNEELNSELQSLKDSVEKLNNDIISHTDVNGGHPNATKDRSGFLSKEEKSKLDSIEPNANYYVHPDKHNPEMIEQTDEFQFVTKQFKNDFNEKPKLHLCESDEEYNELINKNPKDIYAIKGKGIIKDKNGKDVEVDCISAIYFGILPYLPRYIPTERIILDTVRFDLEVGTETCIGAMPYPRNSSFRTFDYEIEGTPVISIDDFGKVTTLKNDEGVPLTGYNFVTIRAKDKPEIFKTILIVVTKPIDIDILNESVTITAGYSLDLKTKIDCFDKNIGNDDIYWKTSDRDIVVVNQIGNITGINPGSCYVTGTIKDGSGEIDRININVIKEIVLVDSIEISPIKNQMFIDEEQEIVYKVLPDNASNKNIIISSNRPDVIMVENNKIKALSEGTAIISIESSDGTQKKYDFEINVKIPHIPVKSIIFSTNIESDKKVGDIFSIKWQVIGDSLKYPATNTNVNIFVNNDNIKYNLIYNDNILESIQCVANKKGISKIKITSVDNPNIWVEKEINISENKKTIPVKWVEIEYKSIVLNLDDDSRDEKITAIVKPTNASNKAYYWESSNESVVTIDYQGNMVARNIGKAYVTCHTVDGDHTATCEVRVTANNVEVTEVVLLLSESEKRILIGEENKYKLPVTVYPIDAANKDLEFTTTNESIAEVDSNGFIIGKISGKCTIKASSKSNPRKSTSCSIIVVSSMDDIVATDLLFENVIYAVSKGNTLQLKPIFLPLNTTDKTITWSTTDESVATVNTNGLVTGISFGNCRIYAYNRASNIKVYIDLLVTKENLELDEKTATDVKLTYGYTKYCQEYETFTQAYSVLPPTATEYVAALKTESDFPDIASVDNNYVICNSRNGFTVIRTKFENEMDTHLQLFVSPNVLLEGFMPAKNIFNVKQDSEFEPRFICKPYNYPFNKFDLEYSIIEGSDLISIEDNIIKGIKPGIATVNAEYRYEGESIETKFRVNVVDKTEVFSIAERITVNDEIDIENSNGIFEIIDDNKIKITKGDYEEIYLLYSEEPEKPYVTVKIKPEVYKYLKVTREDNDSIFRLGGDLERPTSGINTTLIPRYNFRYNDVSNIRFRNEYTTERLTETTKNELYKISKDICLVEDPNSKSYVRELAFPDTWSGLTDNYVNHNGVVSYFEMCINDLDPDHSEREDTIKRNVTLHEFLHVLGFDDIEPKDQTEKNKNTIMSYYRDNFVCDTMQPSETYTLCDMYGFESDVNDLVLNSGYKISSKRIYGGDYDLTKVRMFDYRSIDDNELEKRSDVVIVGFVDKIETKDLDIGFGTIMKYDIFTLIVSEIEKGDIKTETVKVKIPAGSSRLKLGKDYLLYLKEFNNVPMSPLNLDNAIIEL